MLETAPRFSRPSAFQESPYLRRILENLRLFIHPLRGNFSSANGAPLHLLEPGRHFASRRSQGASFVTHAAFFTAAALLAMHPSARSPKPAGPHVPVIGAPLFPTDFFKQTPGSHGDPGSGAGGNRDQLPATIGNLPPHSSIQLLRPSLPPETQNHFVVPPTILDRAAPPVVSAIDEIGLPWHRDSTNSSGINGGHTLGDGGGERVGDRGDGPVGAGESKGRYAEGGSYPSCLYCPDPAYTDEAREAKMQGLVRLRVLVDADGRASRIELLQGLGLGLDERAVQTVRSWRFKPARDAAGRPAPASLIIELMFRLF